MGEQKFWIARDRLVQDPAGFQKGRAPLGVFVYFGPVW